MKHIAWLVLVLVGCTDFESINRGVCGNGLLEEGEDCDSTAASCVSCSLTCTVDTESTACPSGYRCGVDQLCHGPGGVLGLPRTGGTFQADEVRITDIDHDGVGDVFGLTRTSLVIRYGDEANELDEHVSIVTPTQTGPATFGDLDRDGALDVTLTTPDGMVSYASNFGQLSPVPVNERLISQQNQNTLDLRRFFHIAPNVLSAVLVDGQTDTVALISVDGKAAASDQIVVTYPCGARIGQITGASLENVRLDVYNVSAPAATVIDAVISISTGTGASRRFCVLSVHRDAPNFFTGVAPKFVYTDITPLAVGTPTSDPVLADMDIDNDPCPGFVTTDAGLTAAPVYWEGEMQGGHCVMLPQQPSPQNPRNLQVIPAPATAKLLGRVPVLPAVGGITSDALITTEGVYVNFIGFFFHKVYGTTRRITEYGTGDFNGDGAYEVVFAEAGQEDLDVLFRVGDQPGFNLYRIDTATAVASLTTGDFDGDGVTDIAYTEPLEDFERLLVAYGTPDRPLEPRVISAFNGVTRIDRISFGDTVDQLSTAEDIVVHQPPLPGKTERLVTVLKGSPQRTLLSYFDPRLDVFKQETVFRAAVIGNFIPESGSTPYTDLIAIAPARPPRNETVNAEVRAWKVPGTEEGLDGTATSGVMMSGLVDCSLGLSGDLCLDDARYTAYTTGPDHDVVISVDRLRRASMFDPWATGGVSSRRLDVLTALIPTGTVPRTLRTFDLDGDGTHELLATFVPEKTGNGATSVIVTCTMAGGIPQMCEDVTPAIKIAADAASIPVEQCYDATVGRMSARARDGEPDPTADLIVACRGGELTSIFRVRKGAGAPVIERIATRDKFVTSVNVGDVNGDNVEDLILLEGETASSLVVYPQCTNRDLGCVKGGN